MAHVTALAAARHRVLADAGWDVDADGLIGAPPVRVFVGRPGTPPSMRRYACSVSVPGG
jgi:hypothetical protein